MTVTQPGNDASGGVSDRVRYAEFLGAIERRTGMTSSDDARRAASAVITALGERLGGPDRAALEAALPGSLAQRTERDANPDAVPGVDPEPIQLSAEVARRAAVTPERARVLAEEVLAELAAEAPALAERLRARLPDGLAELLVAGPIPDAVDAGRPRRLTDDELAVALRRLTDWSGDTSRIARTVVLPAYRIDPLQRRVRTAERDLNHHARVTPADGGVTFTVWTHSMSAVTELDVRLAERIDAAVADT